MADEHDKWLDREAAERLLRGEPLEAVAEQDALRARRLTAALDALTVTHVGPDGELAGEDAALKAFREARAVSAVDRAAAAELDPSVQLSGRSVRIGRHRAGAAAPAGPGPGPGDRHGPRWGRPVRFGLAAAVAACMVGGVAVAAGTGVLPSPFGGWSDPSPATSVSSAPSEQPLSSPSDSAEGSREVLPDDSRTPDPPSGSPGDPERDGASKDHRDKGGPSHRASPGDTADDTVRGSDMLRRRIVETCARYRAGELRSDEKNWLRDSAKDTGREADVGRFCDRVLGQGGGAGDSGGHGSTGGKGDDEDGGTEDGDSDGLPSGQPSAAPSPSESLTLGAPVPSDGPSPQTAASSSAPVAR
ncbi:hypothetical protein GTW43_07905 [Streptomyces sp. SID5785]|uniref:hypothetical protein n=1 Tax=Streptomyces sp. SID5785 TaxID=2690309 RepID=UPI001360C980|nr:hypothetical protein [Streptomyces sp. SID5785]MZD05008.1 hypothetical protein [Streptomyces sp. SID5785]